MKITSKIALMAIAIMTTATIVFVACKKESTNIDKVATEQVVKHQKLNGEGEANPWGRNWTYDETLKDCPVRDPYDCYDEIIVYPNNRITYNQFLQAVTSGTEGVVNTFSNNFYQEIMPELEEEMIDSLTSGEYYIHLWSNSENNKNLLIATHDSIYTNHSNILLVFQFRFISEIY